MIEGVRTAGGWLVAVAVSLLPERIKMRPRFSPYAWPAAHVISGAVQALLAAATFVVGMLAYVHSFAHGPGWEFLSNQSTTTHREWFAMGALGFLSYLVRPTSWLLLYLYAEGLVRILEISLSERLVGSALVAVPWRLAVWIDRRSRHARLEERLGPPRPDEVVLPEASRFAMLEIYSRDEKPWSEVQVIRYGDAFYRLAEKRLVERGAWQWWRYRLHRTEEREVIRGAILPYDPCASAAKVARRKA
ncbi:MAG: hypothetical protein ACOY3Y_14960 [Acidobacteriota bacterium]